MKPEPVPATAANTKTMNAVEPAKLFAAANNEGGIVPPDAAGEQPAPAKKTRKKVKEKNQA